METNEYQQVLMKENERFQDNLECRVVSERQKLLTPRKMIEIKVAGTFSLFSAGSRADFSDLLSW